MTRIPDVEGSDLVPGDPDVLSIGDRAAAEAATRKLAEGYEDRAWGCMSSRHKFCREPCPVYQVTRNEQHTSYGFHATVAAMSQGLVDLEDAYEQYAYCTQCGACELRCPNTLFTGDFYRNRTQLVQLVKAVRAAGVEAGIERGSWKQWNADTVAYRNELQGDPAQVAGWADDLDLPRGGETILFCDCMAAYRQTKVPRAVSMLLREAGVEVGLMNDQWCCGGPALEMGYVDIYEEFARHNLEDWRQAGAKRVVTLDVAVAAYGSEGEVAAARDRLMRIGTETGGRYLGEELSELDWASRHDRYATPLQGRSRDRAVHMSWHCEDAAITYSQLPLVKRRWHEIADRYIAEHEVFDNWGMFFYTNNPYKGWGDFLVEIDIGIWEQRLDEHSWRAWTQLKREITQVSLDAGGSISACHGATREGEVELVPAELGGQFDLMLKLKRMLDPNNIMNPGKYLLDQAYHEEVG